MGAAPRHAAYDLATEAEVRHNGLSINGEEFPYHIDSEGPHLQTIDAWMSVLWVPVLVAGPVTVQRKADTDG